MCFHIHIPGEDIKQKLHYFTQVEHLSQRLNSTTMSVNSEAFFNILAKIDECLDYMRNHVIFLILYHMLSNILNLVLSVMILK